MSDTTVLLKPAQVAEMFGVDPKTISRWAQLGLLPYFVTPGGHRRFRKADIQALIVAMSHDIDDGSV